MAIFEGPARSGEELAGPSTPQSQGPEAPALTPERSKQELEKLATIITSNEALNFLEPRVRRCQENGGADMPTLLSFYRLISQALAEELSGQRERLQAAQAVAAQAKQTSAQAQMQAALEEASQAVQMVAARGDSVLAGTSSGGSGAANEEVLQKLEQSEKQSERLLQDMQNMRNRAKIDVEVRVFKELEKFSQSLIPSLDAFHQAMPTLRSTSDIGSVVTGVTMIYEQLLDSLEKAGLKRLKVVGEKFDPRYHEAIGEVVTNDVPDEHVVDELQPGYVLGERMIRAAMVRLARNDSAAAPPPPAAAQAAPPPAQASAPPPQEAPAPAQTAAPPAQAPTPPPQAAAEQAAPRQANPAFTEPPQAAPASAAPTMTEPPQAAPPHTQHAGSAPPSVGEPPQAAPPQAPTGEPGHEETSSRDPNQ